MEEKEKVKEDNSTTSEEEDEGLKPSKPFSSSEISQGCDAEL